MNGELRHAPPGPVVSAQTLNHLAERVGDDTTLLVWSAPGVGVESTASAVSIVTTVYDRVDCLRRCICSVRAQTFKDYEHIIVADAPSEPILRDLTDLVMSWQATSPRLILMTLRERCNDWGITPAVSGLKLSTGRYIAFLSDDNGYTPAHLENLVSLLEHNEDIGFAYSSCLYGGDEILNDSPPRWGKVDLGQPLFRRELFQRYFGGTLPFHQHDWDWKMIESLMNSGVRWQHLDVPSFIFRLHRYPWLIHHETP